MNKKDRKNIFLIILIILYSAFSLLYMIGKKSQDPLIINGLFVCIVTFIAYLLYGFQKYDIDELRKKIILEFTIGICIYFIFIYTLGIFTGFLVNSYSLSFKSIVSNAFIPLVTMIALELFRYIIISSNRNSRWYVIIFTTLIILLDAIFNYQVVGNDLTSTFVFFSTIILPIIIKDMVLSYITYHVGYEPSMIYSICMSIYIYILPIFPNLGNYLTCILNITLPSLLFIYSSRIFNDYYSNNEEKKFNLPRIIFLDMPLIIIFTIFVGLISGYFSYYLVGVKRSAIKEVKRGDAAMICQKCKQYGLKSGNIIAYKSNDDIIIDRIGKISDGNYYVTKSYDKTTQKYKYRKIKKNNILGTYVFKIKKIAYPTIKFNEFLRGEKSE